MLHRFCEAVIEPALDAADADTVIEIGVERGRTATFLLERAKRRGRGVVHGIDPAPRLDVDEWADEHGEAFRFHLGTSLEVLPDLGPADAVIVDGDHNYYTVLGELRLIRAAAKRFNRELPLIICHDVDWPYGRRDLYYNPDTIPPEHRQPMVRGALMSGRRETGESGMNGGAWNAELEGGPRNGVLTAIEDFRRESDESTDCVHVPGFHGLGLIASTGLLAALPALQAEFDHLRSAEFLAEWAGEIEGARIDTRIAGRTKIRKLRQKLAAALDPAS